MQLWLCVMLWSTSSDDPEMCFTISFVASVIEYPSSIGHSPSSPPQIMLWRKTKVLQSAKWALHSFVSRSRPALILHCFWIVSLGQMRTSWVPCLLKKLGGAMYTPAVPHDFDSVAICTAQSRGKHRWTFSHKAWRRWEKKKTNALVVVWPSFAVIPP